MFDSSFKIDIIAPFDTDADLNCIKEGIVPVKYRPKINVRLNVANNSRMRITDKTEA